LNEKERTKQWVKKSPEGRREEKAYPAELQRGRRAPNAKEREQQQKTADRREISRSRFSNQNGGGGNVGEGGSPARKRQLESK